MCRRVTIDTWMLNLGLGLGMGTDHSFWTESFHLSQSSTWALPFLSPLTGRHHVFNLPEGRPALLQNHVLPMGSVAQLHQKAIKIQEAPPSRALGLVLITPRHLG